MSEPTTRELALRIDHIEDNRRRDWEQYHENRQADREEVARVRMTQRTVIFGLLGAGAWLLQQYVTNSGVFNAGG